MISPMSEFRRELWQALIFMQQVRADAQCDYTVQCNEMNIHV